MTEQTENIAELSSRKRRIAAFLIDHSVVSFLLVSIVFIALGPDFLENENAGNIQTIMALVMIPGVLLYLSKDALHGISVGKWVMGIMVKNDSDNGTPSFGKLFVRNLPIMIWPVEFIVLAVSSDKKRIGDKIAKTAVLKDPHKTKRLPRILVLVGLAISFFLFTYFTAGTAMKNSDAYQVAIETIESDESIIESTGGIIGYGHIPNGNINITNGYGAAQLEIEVKGHTNDIDVSVRLRKEPEGEWIVKEIAW